MWRRSAIALLALCAACGGAPDAGGPTSTSSTPILTTPATTVPLVPGCPEGAEFTEGGHVGRINQALSDSDTIGSISWEVSESCETYTISFETSEGAPATTPPTTIVDYLGNTPIVRVRVGTAATVITDQLVETGLVERLYVVRSLDGGMFVDFHLAAPAQARVEVDTSPAAVRLALQPGIVEHPIQPLIAALTVVVDPLAGDTVSSPVEITGYSRTFEANVLLIATSGGEVVAQEHTTSADYLETWGEFRASIELPVGSFSVFVGDASPEDGTLQGVTLTLTVR